MRIQEDTHNKMPPMKQQRQRSIDLFLGSSQQLSLSEESEFIDESDHLDTSSSSNYDRLFLPRWKKLYQWAQYDEESDVVYCRDCRVAGFKNDFAVGKSRHSKDWKKEYLQRHAG